MIPWQRSYRDPSIVRCDFGRSVRLVSYFSINGFIVDGRGWNFCHVARWAKVRRFRVMGRRTPSGP